MFHSIPAALTFAGVAFLVSGCNDLQLRYFKSAGIFLGVMSHLLLDEIYSLEWHRGRWRFKKSFGTAMKLWGKNRWANVSTYGKLIVVALMILGEPMVMERYGQNYGQLSKVVIQRDQWRPDMAVDPQLVQTDPRSIVPPDGPVPIDRTAVPQSWYPPNVEPPVAANQPPPDRTIYDTARRFWQNLNGASEQR
jgi:hypothetical protein